MNRKFWNLRKGQTFVDPDISGWSRIYMASAQEGDREPAQRRASGLFLL